NLTRGSKIDNMQPAFSPDGERIAFRSERDGGGIFVMSASGEGLRRITNFGYDPVWSPDGAEIACGTAVSNSESRVSSQRQIVLVNLATGERRSITSATGNAMQPSWSPHGHRIAYWSQIQGRLDIWTVPASAGGVAVAVTNDADVD